jgi:hypothetical protein
MQRSSTNERYPPLKQGRQQCPHLEQRQPNCLGLSLSIQGHAAPLPSRPGTRTMHDRRSERQRRRPPLGAAALVPLLWTPVAASSTPAAAPASTDPDPPVRARERAAAEVARLWRSAGPGEASEQRPSTREPRAMTPLPVAAQRSRRAKLPTVPFTGVVVFDRLHLRRRRGWKEGWMGGRGRVRVSRGGYDARCDRIFFHKHLYASQHISRWPLMIYLQPAGWRHNSRLRVV